MPVEPSEQEGGDTEQSSKEYITANVLWTQYGEEQPEVSEPSTLERCLSAASVTGVNH